ncbi:DNA-binding domain-containing protein [Cocleimonas sp. KMM 6892]|uniref:HvfC/BufC N-terminal domain-containing protein n=1 Tax=unclassified Cocleimonas TaxID=2639732 RepID=UPI002DBD0E5E|nr:MULTISPECIES: DNA-binding domain-containing protein [unclassified Cocleimonas]MEB8430976.1 DNA-binding domain-containing protein [Cocleimonas sp. KMM 6892]MEC4714252.1 DNA-binding domain-containing protein [Cocleimonas sp. KMM 6895]MEC4743583.1 DNA-binding domain-containing protein [Cocleimonas sp. KMM 6896]
MSELYRLQKSMMSFLLENDNAIQTDIVSTAEVSAKVRLDIYGAGYGYRLIDALSENYPSVHTLLGDDGFYTMSYAYMKAHPSHHFSLRYFGSHLEEFLAKEYSDVPVLAEMARFEWAQRKAFDSNNTTSISMESLQQIPIENWGQLQFDFHPSVSRINFEWNTPQLWAAIDEQLDPIPPEKLDYPLGWVVWRKELLNYYRSLDVDEAWALDSAMQSGNFEGLCEGVCEWVDAELAPARIAGFLSQWIEDGLLTGLTY